MRNTLLLLPILFFSTNLAGQAEASTCMTGDCHKALLNTKYVHGPVAAEKAGGKGCVACHVPAGKKCSPGKGGSFKPMPSAAKMCQVCHSKGTGTQHSEKNNDCLKCHDPHGSATSPIMKR